MPAMLSPDLLEKMDAYQWAPRMSRSIAQAKPSSLLLSVTKSAARCTSGLAFPIAMRLADKFAQPRDNLPRAR